MPARTRILLLTLLAVLFALPILGLDVDFVLAQTRSPTTAIAAEGFVPVPGGKPATEEVDASVLVLVAYGAFALAFVGYLVHLARAQSKIARDIQELGSRIDRADREG